MFLILSILLGLLPGVAWLIFFLKEDPKPEPPKLIAFVFFVGALTVYPTALIEGEFADFVFSFFQQSASSFAGLTGQTTASLVILLLGLAAIEEIIKFLAAFLSIHTSRFFDEAIDAMIYMIAAGLGFATAENILFALNVFQEGLAAGLIETSVLGGVAETLTLRFVGATLLHALSSALIGYSWAHGIVQKQEKHFIVGGLTLATLLHTLFNFLIIKFGESQLLYPSYLLVIVAILVFYDFEKLKGIPRKRKSLVTKS